MKRKRNDERGKKKKKERERERGNEMGAEEKAVYSTHCFHFFSRLVVIWAKKEMIY